MRENELNAHTEGASRYVTSILVKLSGVRTAFGRNSGKSFDAEGASLFKVNLSGFGQSTGNIFFRALFFYVNRNIILTDNNYIFRVNR